MVFDVTLRDRVRALVFGLPEVNCKAELKVTRLIKLVITVYASQMDRACSGNMETLEFGFSFGWLDGTEQKGGELSIKGKDWWQHIVKLYVALSHTRNTEHNMTKAHGERDVIIQAGQKREVLPTTIPKTQRADHSRSTLLPKHTFQLHLKTYFLSKKGPKEVLETLSNYYYNWQCLKSWKSPQVHN